MLAALGSIASYALPQLLSFASKKLMSTPLGSKVKGIAKAGGFDGMGTDIKRNFIKMMNNTYDRNKSPGQNAMTE
jgi:hypothetical protein